jgi:hypothetical protein
MKKVLFTIVVASALTACGGGASTAPATVDSTKVDTTKMATVDSTKMDSTKMAAMDSTKKDSTKTVADTTKK